MKRTLLLITIFVGSSFAAAEFEVENYSTIYLHNGVGISVIKDISDQSDLGCAVFHNEEARKIVTLNAIQDHDGQSVALVEMNKDGDSVQSLKLSVDECTISLSEYFLDQRASLNKKIQIKPTFDQKFGIYVINLIRVISLIAD